MQYIENFNNPYVKLLVVCKICNKEQSLKFAFTWKRHYLTHTASGEKPFKCLICGNAYKTKDGLRNHKKKHDQSEVTNLMKIEKFEE